MDKNIHIQNSLNEHYKEALEQGHEVFGVFLQGSQNYGLDLYTEEYQSDVDTKAILLPSFEDFCLNRQAVSTTHVRANNEHIDLKDIRIMFETFKKQNVNFIEILFTKYFRVNAKYAKYVDMLHEIRDEISVAHRAQAVRTMSGLCGEKRKALCHPYPTLLEKINKYGYDGKQLSHIIRINDFLRRYTSGESYENCLQPSDSLVELIMDAKLNKFSLEEAIALADKYDADAKKMKDEFIEKNGDVVVKETYEKLDSIKIMVLRQHFKEQLTNE